MGNESITETNLVDDSFEDKDRFSEFMEMRHRNAMMVLKIEEILSQEELSEEYPTTLTPENIRIKKEVHEVLQPILESLSSYGLIRKIEHVKEVIDGYFHSKITAQRVELKLKEKLKKEGKEPSPLEIGSELFKQRTGEYPTKPVQGIRQEGYFILLLNNDDYLRFIKEFNRDESSGLFHKAMRFPNMTVDIILSKNELVNKVVLHERQHFINNSILNDFTFIENRRVPIKQNFPLLSEGVSEQKAKIIKGLSGVKDELLARIRDGSDSFNCTNFFNQNIYKYLRDEFSEDEKKEVIVLLNKIELELKSVLNLFRDNQSRGMLVYHLIDASLLRFPEKIEALTKFYSSKINEFTSFIPDEENEKQIQDKDLKNKLKDLRLNITGEAYSISEIILGSNFRGIQIDYNELQIRSKEVKEKIRKLREDYNVLLKTI